MDDKILQNILKEISRIADALENNNDHIKIQKLSSKQIAFIWEAQKSFLRPASYINKIDLSLLKGIQEQTEVLLRNTERFAKGYPANNALLWGAKGTGKSSLVKSVFFDVNQRYNKNLSLIEINREDLETLPILLQIVRKIKRQIIIYCDDLSFDLNDTSFKSLKAVLEGGIEGRPENVVFYATSNRRHLMPNEMSENTNSSFIAPSDTINENISLSDRFGIWLGFHNIDQKLYLEIIDAYVQKYDLDKTSINIHKNALSWAVQRGSRSGRVAWQFILDLAGKIEKNITL